MIDIVNKVYKQYNRGNFTDTGRPYLLTVNRSCKVDRVCLIMALPDLAGKEILRLSCGYDSGLKPLKKQRYIKPLLCNVLNTVIRSITVLSMLLNEIGKGGRVEHP